MSTVIIIVSILLGVFIIFAFCKMAKINNRIDDIYHKALTMQGEIEANAARSKDNYKFIAQVNTEVEKVKSTIAQLYKQESTDEILKEVEEYFASHILEEEPIMVDCEKLSVRRETFAHLRGLGKSIKEAGEAVGVSYSTAKRYEQWRKDNKK